MQTDDVPVIDPTEDLSQILPIQQKRTIAFINHFIMQTVSYLNNFAQSCESRLMEFDYKMQKIEACLLIIESQLSSIEGLDNPKLTNIDTTPEITTGQISPVNLPDINKASCTDNIPEKGDGDKTPQVPDVEGITAKDDPRFQKFFKMLQFGVPQQAVKLKMQSEAVDPNIIDRPDDIIPGLLQEHKKET